MECLSEDKKQLVLRHLELVIKANEKVNLTRISDFDEGLLLHIEDSLAAILEMNEAPEGLYGDMGSGAGYPGIPLAVATGRQTVLIDARKKKMDTMASIIEELGLKDQVQVYAGRAELLAKSQKGEFAVLTARALSKLSILMELAAPLLQKNGMLVCYKAHLEEEELKRALEVQRLLGMEFHSDRSFKLGDHDRRILTFVKSGKPKMRLPRQEGQAQKNPL